VQNLKSHRLSSVVSHLFPAVVGSGIVASRSSANVKVAARQSRAALSAVRAMAPSKHNMLMKTGQLVNALQAQGVTHIAQRVACEHGQNTNNASESQLSPKTALVRFVI